MENKTAMKLFEQQQIRTHWDDEQEKWYFSVQDVVHVLTESKDVKQYIKRIKSRDTELNSNWGTICTLVEMTASDGKTRKIQASDTEGLFRIIQSIPSPKAEPFKRWLAKVAKQRVDEIDDPELGIDRAMENLSEKRLFQRMGQSTLKKYRSTQRIDRRMGYKRRKKRFGICYFDG